MTVQENEALARAEVDKYNAHDLDGLGALFSSDAEILNVPTGVSGRGAKTARDSAQTLLTAFPDGKFEIISVVAGERGAAIEYWGRGTHTGNLVARAGALQPTGRKLEVRICDVMDIQGGKITSVRSYWDLYGVLSQLGLTPEPAHP
ncbi:MAG TPA: ester cyclase [Ktedonobacterales bacterium]|nr:ester cyclase [Ktedonobacterales bacterium]